MMSFLQKCPWRHQWKPYKAISVTYKDGFLFSPDALGTLVSEQCESCKRRRQRIVRGVWSLEELTT